MGIVIAIANQKGGVGKTTTCVNLAASLTATQRRVLLVDIDPQGNATMGSGIDKNEIDKTVCDVLLDDLPVTAAIRLTAEGGYVVLPANQDLTAAEVELLQRPNREYGLRNALAAVVADYDYVLIDCPPVLGILLINALAACQHLIIPVQTEFLAMKGLERMLNTLNMVLRARTEPFDYTIVPTYYDQRTRASVDSLAQLRHDYDAHLWSGYVPVDTKLRDASRAGVPPAFYDPRSRAVTAYTDLLETLLRGPAKPDAQAEAAG